MITSGQIEAWIDEIEQRPGSAAAIIRAITARLAELDSWNEELLADNIALRSGERAEVYEKRIASLEYQLEMLKRQVGESALTAVPAAGGANLLLFNLRGQVLRQSFTLDGLTSGAELARFNDDPAKEPVPPGLLVISPHEELLFAFELRAHGDAARGENSAHRGRTGLAQGLPRRPAPWRGTVGGAADRAHVPARCLRAGQPARLRQADAEGLVRGFRRAQCHRRGGEAQARPHCRAGFLRARR